MLKLFKRGVKVTVGPAKIQQLNLKNMEHIVGGTDDTTSTMTETPTTEVNEARIATSRSNIKNTSLV